MTGPTPLRLGIGGGGIMGERFADAAARLDGVEVAAIADPDAGQRERLATRYGARVHAGWEALVDDGELDALYLGLPHHLHAPAAVAAAERGLDVLLDKPLATTVEDGRLIVEAARANGTRLMLGFSHRFHVELATARRTIADGLLGDVLLASDLLIDSAPHGPAWYFSRDAGGGVVDLQMHHSFDRMAWLLGSPIVRVHAQLSERPVRDGAPVDLAAAVTLTFANGVIGTSAASFAPGYDGDSVVELVVQGTEGHMRLETWQSIEVQSRTSAVHQRQLRDDWLGAELREFVRAIREDREPSVTGEDGLRALHVAAAVRESAAMGRPAQVSR